MEQNEKREFDVKGLVKRKKGEFILLVFGLFLGIYFDWSIVQILIFLVFLWSLLGPIRSKYLAGASLVFLGLTSFLLLLKRTEQAEDFAIYAFYFLAMAVIQAIFEAQKDGKEA